MDKPSDKISLTDLVCYNGITYRVTKIHPEGRICGVGIDSGTSRYLGGFWPDQVILIKRNLSSHLVA